DRHRPAPFAQGFLVSEHHLSGEIGIWISPLMCLIGPADDGITSKSNISVGSHKVAQALGTSTTPEMWPWHGAVPRMEERQRARAKGTSILSFLSCDGGVG